REYVIIRREWFAVGPFHIVAQLEGDDLAVGSDAAVFNRWNFCGNPRQWFILVIERNQPGRQVKILQVVHEPLIRVQRVQVIWFLRVRNRNDLVATGGWCLRWGRRRGGLGRFGRRRSGSRLRGQGSGLRRSRSRLRGGGGGRRSRRARSGYQQNCGERNEHDRAFGENACHFSSPPPLWGALLKRTS